MSDTGPPSNGLVDASQVASQAASVRGQDPHYIEALASLAAIGSTLLTNELPTTDPLSTLIQKHLSPHMRPLRDLSGDWHTRSFTSDNQPAHIETHASTDITPHTVRQAAASSAWRKIARLARTHIQKYAHHDQSDQLDTLQDETSVQDVLEWWSVRLYSLARLKLYSILSTELNGVWQVIETTAVERGKMLVDTDMVPFTMRVLKATEAKYRGDVRSSVEAYVELIRLCKRRMRELESKQPKIWKERAIQVGLMLAFTLAETKDYAGAIQLVVPLVESALESKSDPQDAMQSIHLVVVASRIWIQAGHLSSAMSLLDRAQLLLASPPPAYIQHQLAHSRALIHAISGDFSSASFVSASTLTQQLNSAISCFYSAHLDDAISRLQSVLAAEPASVASVDAVIFNLATLYELAKRGDAEVLESKTQLLATVASWAGEPGVSSSAFKL